MRETDAIWALGAMSGTSLDGVDAALLRTDGHTIFEFGDCSYRPYSEVERGALNAALGKMEGAEVTDAAEIVEVAHAELLLRFDQASLVGFHGQTLWHDPAAGQTFQCGDGQVLCEALQRPVVWDFRSADVALGGEGAPLAPFYHFALAKYLKFTKPVVFLNIGGVANMTWVDPGKLSPEEDGALLAFDTGPGNALMNDLMAVRRGVAMDADGTLAATGDVNEAILTSMLSEPRYFARVPPKSLDRNDFSGWTEAVKPLSDADALATLAAGTAGSIVAALAHCPSPPSQILVTGGGRKNPTLMELIDGLAPCTISPVEVYGLDGDMLEAQAFAYLAVRVQRGLPTSAPMTTGVAAPVGGGKISHPIMGTKRLTL